MKKLTTFILTLLLFAFTSIAQPPDPPGGGNGWGPGGNGNGNNGNGNGNGGNGQGAPIDDGTYLLLALGLTYGIVKVTGIRRKLKNGTAD